MKTTAKFPLEHNWIFTLLISLKKLKNSLIKNFYNISLQGSSLGTSIFSWEYLGKIRGKGLGNFEYPFQYATKNFCYDCNSPLYLILVLVK